MTYQKAHKDFQVQYWTEVIKEAKGNLSAAAIASGVTRTHVFRVMDRLGLREFVADQRDVRRGRIGQKSLAAMFNAAPRIS